MIHRRYFYWLYLLLLIACQPLKEMSSPIPNSYNKAYDDPILFDGSGNGIFGRKITYRDLRITKESISSAVR